MFDDETVQRAIETANSYNAGNIGPLDDAWTRRLVGSTVATESSGGLLDLDNGIGFFGRYQAGVEWLVDAGFVNAQRYQDALAASGYDHPYDWGVSGGVNAFLENPDNWNDGLSMSQYLQSAELQDRAFQINSTAAYEQAVADGVLSPDSDPAIVAGFLKARHIAGYGGAVEALEGGAVLGDVNGTTNHDYFHDIASNEDGLAQYFAIDNAPAQSPRPSPANADPLADGVLQYGDRGEPVAQLQRALGIADDGVFLDQTRDAVTEHQRRQNLRVDGVAGPEVFRSLGLNFETGQAQTPSAPAVPVEPATQPDRVWPVPGRSDINLSDKSDIEGDGHFDSPRAGGLHDGLDIQGEIGDPVVAMAAGTVVYASNSLDPDGYGNSVLIDHGDGTATFYAHLDSISVREGDQVGAGMQVGTLGADGNAQDIVAQGLGDPHLHFEVIEGYQSGNLNSGTAVDPLIYLDGLQPGQGNAPTRPGSSPAPMQDSGARTDNPTLQFGDSGPQVELLQRQLQMAGFDPGPIDGYFEGRVEAAVKDYQAAKGLDVDGVVGDNTWAQLAQDQQRMQASAVPATEQNAPSQAGTTEPAPPSAGMHAHGEPPVVSAQPPQLEPHEQRTSPDTTGSQSPSVTPEPARPNPPSGAQSMDEPPVAVPPQQTVPSGQAQPNASMSSPKADASETPTVEQIGNSALELSRMTLQYVNSTPNLQDDPVGLEIARLAMEIAQRAQQIEQRQQQAMPEQAATAMPTEPQTQAPLSPEPVPLTQSAATATPSTPETVPTLEQDPVGRLEAIAAQLSQAAALQQETLLQTAPEQVAVQRSMPEQPAQATPQAMPEGMITAKSEPQHFTDIGSDIAATAREWAGRDYKPGESERCQDFVNHVLNSTQPGLADRIGTTQQAIDGLESGELLASRFFGDDVSRKVSDLSQAKPGDIVGFANTYGDYPAGTITHVGIYVGDGMVVDRPTADRPVQLRSIETFGADNFVIVRPDAYENVKSLKSDADVEPQNATSKSMSNHANVASLDSSIVPSTILAAEKGTILISSSDHPDNALYQQALKGVKMLPDTMIASQEQSERMAAAIVLEAKSGGLQQVAGVVAHPNGSGLFVVDKQDMADPSAKRVFVDAQMASRPLSETNQMIDQTGKQPPSPSQPESRDESERRVGMMVA